MKLSLITEDAPRFYKGVSEYSGLENWPTHKIGSKGRHIPGFLSSWEIARTYSDPELAGPPDSAGMIAEFKVDTHSIEDRTEEFIKWCDSPQGSNPSYDISVAYPEEWQKDGSIWTICESGSGHAGVSCFGNASFIYCGIALPYTVIAFYNNLDEWERAE